MGIVKKRKETNSNEDLDVIIFETISEVLSLLGESPKAEISLHLLKAFGINRKVIPNYLADFLNALEKLLREGGKFLEISLMKQLQKKTTTLKLNGGRLDRYEFNISILSLIEATKHTKGDRSL